MRKAIFLDRDGIINNVILKNEKPFSPRSFKEFDLREGIRDVLDSFKKLGFINIIVSNQPDIARGLLERQDLDEMSRVIRENLPVDDIYVCTHDNDDNCHCRKPKPGMLTDAVEKWEIDISKSFLIGDNWKDIDAGKNAGCTTILLDYPYNKKISADFRIENFESAIKIVKNKSENI